MSRPNLFQYATSELSQDAFICWLLAWAKPESKQFDEKLHACGTSFIHALFSKHSDKCKPETIDSVEVKKQDKNIDVLCIINDKYFLLIEDKTSSINHSDQLARYLQDIESRPNVEKEKIFPIYFKTLDQASYKNVTQVNGYQVFSRKDFLTILNDGTASGIDNAIFLDFTARMQAIEDSVNSYLSKPIAEWTGQAWVGFFMHLQQEMGRGLWRKINTPSGGFMGFWWGHQPEKPYLQLEESKLCFKLIVKEKERQNQVRTHWFKIIKDNQNSDLQLSFVKPAKFRAGNSMSVMITNDEYRQVKPDGCIDMTATVELLKNMTTFLEKIQQH